MRQPSLVRRIEQETISLHRGRLICALLRREGLLADNPHILISLAERLLKSLSYHSTR